jgi:hypothetical protein
MSRVLTLPRNGTLLVATDLHGHLKDFRAIAQRFLDLSTSTDPPQLVICGDLVHGPTISAAEWPEHLGDFYRDESPAVLDEAQQLQSSFPGQVHFLLGNHEHAHLGGPRLSKFHPDEAAHLESLYNDGGFEPMRRWIATWPLAAVAPAAKLVLTHAAPHAQIADHTTLDTVRLDGYEHVPLHDMTEAGPLGALLWARTTTAERAYEFLHALHPSARVAAFGHDPIREGHLIEHEPLLCISTSFACRDGDKVYLEWDLSVPADSAATVARDGLRSLHPDAPRWFRRER